MSMIILVYFFPRQESSNLNFLGLRQGILLQLVNPVHDGTPLVSASLQQPCRLETIHSLVAASLRSSPSSLSTSTSATRALPTALARSVVQLSIVCGPSTSSDARNGSLSSKLVSSMAYRPPHTRTPATTTYSRANDAARATSCWAPSNGASVASATPSDRSSSARRTNGNSPRYLASAPGDLRSRRIDHPSLSGHDAAQAEDREMELLGTVSRSGGWDDDEAGDA